MEPASVAKKKNPFDNSDARRLASVSKCAQELRSRYTTGKSNLRGVCQPVKTWVVSPTRREVKPESLALTFVCGIGPDTIDFLSNQPVEPHHYVLELLDSAGRMQARVLAEQVEVNPAIRGFYIVRTRVLGPVPAGPEGVIFNRGYFEES